MLIPTDLRTLVLRHYQSLRHPVLLSNLTHSMLSTLLPYICTTKTTYASIPTNPKIKRFEGGRSFSPSLYFPASSYIFNNLLIDTSPSGCYTHLPFSDFNRILLTHHHEDHSGSVGRFIGDDSHEVYMSQQTLDIMSKTKGHFPMQFYEHLLYSRPARFDGESKGNVSVVEDGAYLPTYDEGDGGREVEGYVYSTPGHAQDMVIYHVPEENTLFAGDLFLNENRFFFRSDECFDSILSSVDKILKLEDWDTLLCAHEPVFEGGREALNRKREYLTAIQVKIKSLHQEGFSDTEISSIVFKRATSMRFLWVMCGGDVSPLNIVRSVLYGPVMRNNIKTALLK
ncbi:hypothetical protein TrST_g13501 [Triparma strigata]|uniref:Metallo-beta-lactamase domain-containing protein n=1 Tax=Triparma strigata TaxID=1606541 RepID=A0A9W7E6W8_9STRA|nr:hypothetical protein TrST_g13501 [Triparma strigata]